ncbi:MAG: hypothetical protein JOZ57_16015, partial [Abitibacteriaceae bacterium]|nr:hypothetical protein [Abditibacteriaceae bacterium]
MDDTPVLPQESATSIGLSDTTASSDYTRLVPVLVGIVLLTSCFYGLNAAGIFDRDEGLYTTAARQMVEYGDWMVPRIGPDV